MQQLGDMSNVFVMQAISISKILHSIEFKPTDDAELHQQLEHVLHCTAFTLETMCKEICAKIEEMME